MQRRRHGAPGSVRHVPLALVIPLLATLLVAMPIARSDAGSLTQRPLPPEEAGDARIVWTSCGERLECAHVQVPVDWSHPRRDTITACSDPPSGERSRSADRVPVLEPRWSGRIARAGAGRGEEPRRPIGG